MITYIDNISRTKSTDVATTADNPLAPEVEMYSQQFLSFAKASTENTIAMCELLTKAKTEFKQKEKNNKNAMFNALCKTIGYAKGANDPTIKKFVRIGENAKRFKPYMDRLPSSWTTLYEITQLDPELFEHAIDNGAINMKMIGREVKSLKQINQPQLESKTEKTTEIASITLALDSDADKAVLEAVYKELEVLKFNYKIELSHNKTAAKMLSDD